MLIKQNKKITMIIAIMVCLAMSLTGLYANASLEGRGQLTVTVQYGGTPISGISVNVYYLAAVKHKSGEVVFEPVTQDFLGAADGWNGNLHTLTAQEQVQLAAVFAAHAVGYGIAPLSNGNTGTNGSTSFTWLDTGLYLVTQANRNSASYLFSPTLVAIINEGEAIELRTKTEMAEDPSIVSPTTSPPEPTPPQPTPTPPQPTASPPDDGSDIDDPNTPGDDFPYDLDDPRIPLDPFPDDDLPQTGITNRDTAIIILLALGFVLIFAGAAYLKRSHTKA